MDEVSIVVIIIRQSDLREFTARYILTQSFDKTQELFAKTCLTVPEARSRELKMLSKPGFSGYYFERILFRF